MVIQLSNRVTAWYILKIFH